MVKVSNFWTQHESTAFAFEGRWQQEPETRWKDNREYHHQRVNITVYYGGINTYVNDINILALKDLIHQDDIDDNHQYCKVYFIDNCLCFRKLAQLQKLASVNNTGR